MLRHLVLLIVALLPAASTPPPTGDMGKIQGRWLLMKAEISGDGGNSNLVLSKDKWHFKGDALVAEHPTGGKTDFGPFKLDEKTQPKRIDFKFHDGKVTHTRLGIYELDGNRLRICFSSVVPAREENRPTDFTTPAFGGRMLGEFERIGQ